MRMIFVGYYPLAYAVRPIYECPKCQRQKVGEWDVYPMCDRCSG